MTAVTSAPERTRDVPHTWRDDLLGLVTGIAVVSFGLAVLRAGGTVTGGTAGLSLLLSYGLPVPFGVLFVVVNLPFFALAARSRGWSFTVRSAVAIAAVSTLTSRQLGLAGLADLSVVYAALMGNTLCGVGLLILFRHQASLGGFNVVALIAQDRHGLRAGYVLMVLDTSVVLLSLTVIDAPHVAASALGAVVLSLILALNHRPGRYTGS